MFAITAGCWLIYFFCFVFLPLMSLNRSYWTRWEIRMNREDDEATAFCSSMFGRKRARSPISRWSVCCKPKQSFLRILWLPHWLSPEPMWEQAGLRFCFEGRKFVLPCGSREEADWLISLIQNAGVEVIDDACDELKFVAKY